jgi:ABC-type multidrug transport system fused ATPase/permease subunit
MRICVPTALTSTTLLARTLRALRTHGALAFGIVVGASMHAAGHALLAAAGGVLARSLAGGAGPMDARSMAVLASFGRGDAVVGLAIAGVAAAVVKLVGSVLASFCEAKVAGEVGAAARLDVLDRVTSGASRSGALAPCAIRSVHALRPPRHGDHGSAAHRLAALTTHVHDVERGVASGVLAQARAVVQLVPLAALLACVAPSLALSAALALASFGLVAFAARRALVRAHRRASSQSEAIVGAADEAVRHADVWITFGAQAKVRAHVARIGRAIVATSAHLRGWAAAVSGASEVLGALALLLVVVLAGAGALGGVDRGAVVPFAIAFFMAYKPLRELVDARIAVARADVALERIAAIGAGAREAAPDDDEPRAWAPAELVVDGLVASHGEHAPISFRLPAGRVAAIVGPTGIGKTSLLRALLGLDAARAGRVLYGGEDLTSRGPGPSSRPFAWVPQDAPVLAATLDENVSLGARSGAARASDAAALLDEIGGGALVRSAAGRVLAADRAVSGGERQQIAFARALATHLPVLLLDEPTSALDAGAQDAMLAAIARLRGARSVVLVTHRPEPLAAADVVVRLAPASDLAASETRPTHVRTGS